MQDVPSTEDGKIKHMPLRQSIRFCTARDGVQIAYAVSGSGPPLVKVSNWLSHLEFDVTSPVWGHLLHALSERHTLVRYDQRGTGLSDWTVQDMSFEALYADLEDVIEAAGLQRFALLGLSQGVAVAIAYAARHPDRVTKLVLHGGYARGRRRRPVEPDALVLADTNITLVELGWGKDEASFRQFFTSQFIPGGTPEQQHWFNELERISTSPSNAANLLKTLYEIDVTASLPHVRCPVLVLHATGDLSVPFAEGRFVAGGIDNACFVPLNTANHLMLEQDPQWPRWVSEVQDFLSVPGTVDRDARFDTLTPRERELMELVAQGRDNAQIAAVLSLSDKTVRNHVSSIFRKLGVENRPQAIILARNAGIGLNS